MESGIVERVGVRVIERKRESWVRRGQDGQEYGARSGNTAVAAVGNEKKPKAVEDAGAWTCEFFN